MKTKHTPGPWRIETGTFGGTTVECTSIPPTSVVKVHHSCPEWEANARLIAAAPELLAELKNTLRFIRDQNLIDRIAVVINKAEG